jgi:hypothetical protein
MRLVQQNSYTVKHGLPLDFLSFHLRDERRMIKKLLHLQLIFLVPSGSLTLLLKIAHL